MEKPMLPAILSFQGLSLTDDEKRIFKKYNPVGFNLFSRNIKDREQIKKLIKEVKELLERNDIIFAIDQEGGRVRRLAEPEFRPYLPQHIIGSIYEKNQEEGIEIAKSHAFLISSDLNELGINMNYAPVLDIARETTSPALKSRCFSSKKETVTTLGKTMVNTYVEQNICPCIKHMPGHGRAEVDPHLQLPIINNKLNDLEEDFYPFLINHHSPAGMTAHIVITDIDDKNPITQSKKAIDKIIRGLIAFDGLLISDAIDMKALKGSAGEKAKKSLEAGCDVICYALGNFEEIVDICNSCSMMNGKSLDRFEKIKNIINSNRTVVYNNEYTGKYENKSLNTELYNDIYDATETLNKMTKN